MDSFASPQAQQLWQLFKQTGNINIYRLYFAVQHTKNSTLDNIINSNINTNDNLEM